ncbi:MAG: glycerol-3-phosphate 1-O-acyltransferase PlsY [Clostridia bacterium]|nr:glycerol-3-phosphate 1-O-acyltransferase PlsY [Clostridia bacterium]
MLRFLPKWNLVDALCEAWGVTGDAVMVVSVIGVLLCIAVGYLLGSLNSAIIISRLFLHRDIRAHGSKNAGATNMLRTYGTKYAVMTLALDMIKAAIATTLGYVIFSVFIGAPIAGFFCIFGHMFPVYYRFKGGKGVACTGIVALMLDPWTFLIMLLCFVVITAGTRFVSLASIMCAFLYPLLLRAFFPGGWVQLMGILTTAFVIFMHRENIKRLWNGKESKLTFSRKSKQHSDDEGGRT